MHHVPPHLIYILTVYRTFQFIWMVENGAFSRHCQINN